MSRTGIISALMWSAILGVLIGAYVACSATSSIEILIGSPHATVPAGLSFVDIGGSLAGERLSPNDARVGCTQDCEPDR